MHLSQLKLCLQVIVVDDNYIDHFLVTKLLQKQGYQKPVQCFSEATAALLYLQNHMVQENTPCILFLDINMPFMNGFEFLRSYSNLHKALRDQYTIIMLSSSFSADDIAQANADSNVKCYLDKPLTAKKMEAALERLGLLTID